MLTSTADFSPAPPMRALAVDALLLIRSTTACLVGEHSRMGENSKNTAVSDKTAKMSIGHFRLDGQTSIPSRKHFTSYTRDVELDAGTP